MAEVHSEFRSDVLEFGPEDPVFGGTGCRVAGCGRTARGRGLCQGHLQRWANQGRPAMQQFVASTDPRWRRQQPNQQCRVPSCGYGSARGGMCSPHAQRWQRAGRPDLDGWLADPPPVRQPAAGATCRIPHCPLWPQATSPFCQSHTNTWKVNRRPDIDEFAEHFAQTPLASEMIRLDRLTPQLKLEMQYVLQRRHDERQGKLTPEVVMRVVRALADANASSLLDHDEDTWHEQIRWGRKDTRAQGLFGYAYRAVADLAEAGGWEAEYPRDVWRMRRLGYEGDRTLRFAAIPQPWLRDLAKRWVRWRLSTGLCLEAGGGRPVVVITRFSGFLADIGVERIDQIDRSVLERYLADLRGDFVGAQRRGTHLGMLNRFFAAVRQHRWDTALPADAMFFTEDYPKRAERLPRALAEHVMAQLEHPHNLARFDDPAHRLITIILMRCGLRVTDALRLPADCLVADADGAPYLRYFNHKMKRDALVPIDEQLCELIAEHRQRAAERWPAATPGLFPRPTKNVDGSHPIASTTYRAALLRWLAACDIRDEHGQPVHLTPHQWRHTLGHRLINRDVPQEVVRRILDHDSAQMTGHYARLHDTTVRRQWEAARKVDIHGATVSLDPAGPLADAAWAKQRLGRATQALPNGYCGLPVQQSCPHANACLTCPMFLTTSEFLPQHRAQRQQVLQLVTAAEARGQQRLAEMNRQVLHNLDNIITAIDSKDTKHAG
ncbi:MAG: tyrosine-type recombinase/integrase [Mycolicibacterium sp.]|nr:tyrosine-type recombinase/integrase [Mycolicibacterium sp.]